MKTVSDLVGSLPELPPALGAGDDPSALVRAYLDDVRARLAADHRAGAAGGAVVAAYTEAMDRLLRLLFATASAEYARRSVLLDHRCVVAAQGGYGRAELNPASDVDLLVLYPARSNPYVETVAEYILYALWDAGVAVGHATRNVAECARLAQRDLKVKTALLDARYLAGDAQLYREFERAMEADVLKKGAARFYRDKLAESRERHLRFGSSIYLLEPDLKEGVGGLRDIHTAMWLAKVKYKVKSLHDLVLKSVITDREQREIEASQDFLFRVRNALHFMTGKHQDSLSFEFQDRVAAELGFGGDGTRGPVERCMRAYYGHAAVVQHFSQTIIERCTERPHPYRLLGRVPGREIREGIRVGSRTLAITKSEILGQEPANLVTVFRDAQRHGARLSQATKRLLSEHLHLIGDPERASRRFTGPFLDILKWGHDVWETLRDMHTVGVLSRLFPEFARIDRLVQRDAYHIYTVDEHSLLGVAELERLRHGDYKTVAPLLTEVMREIDQQHVLFLAMLFHDIGKGHGKDHSDRGAVMVPAIAARLGLDDEYAQQFEFLVRQHLHMSYLAQHRDTHDPDLLGEFARLVGNEENLKLLYLLTFADMRAVGRKVWNNWRDTLLGELYRQTMTLFEHGELVEQGEEARAARGRDRAREILPPARVAAFEQFARGMTDRYFATTPPAQVATHLDLVSRLREEWSVRPETEHRYLFTTTLRHFPKAEYSEFTLCTPDRPGLFAMITGVLTGHGLSILGARINTSRGGLALDSFRLGHAEQRERVLEPERWERVETVLGQVLRGDANVESLVATSRQASRGLGRPTSAGEPRVMVHNDVSGPYTVLDVVVLDRVGVLFAITHCLHRLGVVIHVAKITTQLHEVFDVFYVTDADGAKLREGQVGIVSDEIVRALHALGGAEAAPG